MRRAFETVAIDRLDRIGELPDCRRGIPGGKGMAYRRDRVLSEHRRQRPWGEKARRARNRGLVETALAQ